MNSIPEEIFREIIKQSSIVTHTALPRSHIPEISLPPFRASQVCRSWRNTLLNDPTLWTHIQTDEHPDLVEEVLRRSKSAPFHVLVALPVRRDRDRSAETFHTVLREMHRIRILQISDDYDDDDDDDDDWEKVMLDALWVYLGYPAPILQGFNFSILDRNEDARFIPTLFSNNAPNLRHTSLQARGSLARAFHSPMIFRDLSSLHLSLTSRADIHWDMLLNLLESSPGLRSFSLESESFEGVVVSLASTKRRIHLPCLRQLSLGHDIDSDFIANLFLGQLDCPFDTLNFEIAVRNSFRGNNYALIMQFLNRYRLSCLGVYHASMSLYDIHPPNKVFQACYQPSCMLSFLRTFELSNITHLDFHFPPTKDDTRGLLMLLSGLETLTININHCFGDIPTLDSLLEAFMPQSRSESLLTSSASAQDSVESDSLLCPSLRRFIIEIGPYAIMRSQHAELLVKCSTGRGRQQAGFPLKVILDCKSHELFLPEEM